MLKKQSSNKKLPEVRTAINDRAVLRTIHLFEENKRVEKAVSALNDRDFDTFKKTIKASGESSFKYLQNIYSNHNTDQQAVSIALALSEDILGAKWCMPYSWWWICRNNSSFC